MPHLNEEKQVILTLERDSEKHHFTAIASITNKRDETLSQQRGYLPDCPDLFEQFDIWRYELHRFARFIERKSEAVTVNFDLSIEDLLDEEEKTIEELQKQYEETEKKWIKLFHQWLELTDFNKILIELNNKIPNSFEQQVRVIIQTDCPKIQTLPWERWNWLTDNRRGRIILRPLAYQRIPTKQPNRLKVQIILGNSNDNQNMQELQRLNNYFQQFDILPPLKNPNRDQVFDCIQNQQFHILYFGGHGKTEKNIGRIYINESEYLKINDLVFPLQEAIRKGLRLAIFKCCQGIGLKNNLTANKIYIPNLIVTRDIIHEEAAKQFIDDFLDAFVRDKISLHIAFDNARQNLRKSQYPGSSLMPLLFQISEKPQYLDNWFDEPTPQTFTQSLSSDLVIEEAAAIASHKKTSPKPQRSVVKKLSQIAIVSFVVTVLIMGARLAGILEPFELDTLDFLMKLRPEELIDDRILIVIATPEDIAKQKEKPENIGDSISDSTLAKLFEKLKGYEPKTIAFDIYRPVAIQKKYTNLKSIFARENFITICRRKPRYSYIGDEYNKPSPDLTFEHQVGFSSAVPDYDGSQRRHLLGRSKPKATDLCPATMSFNLMVASHYLKQKYDDFSWGNVRGSQNDIYISINLKEKTKKTTFKALEPYSGGYNRVDSGGRQILLNYRLVKNSKISESLYPEYLKYDLGSLVVSETITFGDILNDKISKTSIQNFRDRIILIGIAKDLYQGEDYWQTPYSSKEIPGVFMQAQAISHILSTVLDDRPLLWYLPEWGEWLFIFGLSSLGGILTYQMRSLLAVCGQLLILLSCVAIFCYILILYGCWLPLVPAILVVVATPSTIIFFRVYQLYASHHKTIF